MRRRRVHDLAARVLGLLLGEQAFALERRDAARPRRGDGLAVLLVLDVARREDALDARPRATGDCVPCEPTIRPLEGQATTHRS